MSFYWKTSKNTIFNNICGHASISHYKQSFWINKKGMTNVFRAIWMQKFNTRKKCNVIYERPKTGIYDHET